jgi:hypothetical protein
VRAVGGDNKPGRRLGLARHPKIKIIQPKPGEAVEV